MGDSLKKAFFGVIALGVSCIAIELIPVSRKAAYWNRCLDNTVSWVNESSELDRVALANMIELEKRAKKLNLMELTERTCKWPIGDPATENFWFCGHQAENGKPYCTTHVAIAFQPVSTRRERKQR